MVWPASSLSVTVDPKPTLSCGILSRFISWISLTRFCSMLMRDFDQPLPLLGRLVLGVLAQIAQLAGALDLPRQLGLQLLVELLDLVFEFLQELGLHDR